MLEQLKVATIISTNHPSHTMIGDSFDAPSFDTRWQDDGRWQERDDFDTAEPGMWEKLKVKVTHFAKSYAAGYVCSGGSVSSFGRACSVMH